MNNNQNLSVSIVVPSLNEEHNIENTVKNCLKALEDFKINGEILVINDGSTDKTADIVKNIMSNDNRIKLINHSSPQGIGASFWDGVDHAGGVVFTMIPGDNETDPWEILRYYDLLKHVDIVIPFVINKDVRPLFRRLLSLIYRLIINVTFFVNFNYTNGTILYRKSILDQLTHRNKGFFFQTDILIRLVKRGYLFAEVPYRLGVRAEGLSKAVTFPSFLKVVEGYSRLFIDYYFKKLIRKDGGYTADSQTAQRRKAN
jgi:dolichol-phosphate mannosyltransferase